MTESDHSGGGRPASGSDDRRTAPLDEPVADRVTLARRLRAVERALAGTDGVELETGDAERDLEPMEERLASVEERLDALGRAVIEVGECLVARDRARRIDDGTESVRRAVGALTEAGERIDATDGDGDSGPPEPDPGTDRESAPEREESPTEWLDRVAAGGVAPPPVE